MLLVQKPHFKNKVLKLTTCLFYAISFLGIYTPQKRSVCVHRNTPTRKFTVALFILANNGR